MKNAYCGKIVSLLVLSMVMILGVSETAYPWSSTTRNIKFYVGDNNTTLYNNASPNGTGGTVTLYRSSSSSSGNRYNTSTTITGTTNSYNGTTSFSVSNKYERVVFTPGASYKVKWAKYRILQTGQTPDGNNWINMVDNSTGVLNQNATNTTNITFSSSNHSLILYIWITFESTNAVYTFYTDVFPDIAVSSAYTACWNLVSIAGPSNALTPTTAGTYVNNTTVTPPTIDIQASPPDTTGPYPTALVDNDTTTANAALHIDNTKFWFKLAKPTDTTDSGCELDGISFDDGFYANPPLAGTLALDGTPASTCGASGTALCELSGSYTPQSVTSSVGDAVTRFKFRHKGFYISTSVDSAATYPACGTSTSDNIVPAGQAYYPVGSTQDFYITVNPGCAIQKVEIQNQTYDTATGLFSNSGSRTDVTSTLVSNTYTFTSITSHAKLIVTYIPVTNTSAASNSYCQLPAFMGGITPTKPNVLLIFDTSGSMADYPYKSQTYSCKSPTTPANAFSTLDSCANFYGYFDKTQRYTLTAGTWIPQGTATDFGPLNGVSNISGNYLNWKNMQKVDIVRKILVGGLVEDTVGMSRPANGTNAFTNYVLKTHNNTQIQVGNTEPTGLIHDVYSKVRLGMMVFNDNTNNIGGSSPNDSDGGRIIAITMPDGNDYYASLGASLDVLVAAAESSDTDPGGNTPLAESLYEAVRYFEGRTSVFNTVNGDGTGGTVDYGTMDPVLSSCQKHFIIILTDGQPTNDGNVPSYGSSNITDTDFANWRSGLGGAGLPTPTSMLGNVAYYAHNKDLRSSTLGKTDVSGTQNLTIFTVYAFGDGTGKATLQDAAKYGAYVNEFYPPYSSTLSHNNKPDAGEFDNGYFEATDGGVLEKQLNQALSLIMASTASGTAAAVANNKSGERGANIIKALFYPQWPANSSIKWLGDVMSLWYYLDPVISYSGIYEDSGSGGTTGDKVLDLLVNPAPNSNPALIKPLWSAGTQLHAMSAANRHIYTLLNSSSDLTTAANTFGTGNTSNLKDLLNLSTLPANNTQVDRLINYLRGTDYSEYRSRTVSVSGVSNVWKLGDVINSTPQVQSSVAINAYGDAYNDSSYTLYTSSNQYKARNSVYTGSNDGMLHAFKAGVVTALNDASHPFQIAKMTNTQTEGNEQWAFIPKNALPYMQNQAAIDYCHQCIVDGAPVVADASINSTTTGCATANYWECTRKTTLVPATVVTVGLDPGKDLVPAETSWKTVLVSSMGLGGATRLSGGSCNITNPSLDAAHNTDCVKSPMSDNGLSSYFALDVTDPANPKHMWEFSDNDIGTAANKGLGFTTPGAAIVRINAVGTSPAKADKTKNGRWFAVFASGPTGMIDTSMQFTGRSDQNLKLYIVDLNSRPPFVLNTNYWVKDTGIPFAFANSLNGAAIDLDRWNSQKDGNYSDDVVYITYTKASLTTYVSPTPSTGPYPASSTTNYTDSSLAATYTNPTTVANAYANTTAWNKGGVVRLVTNHDPNPANWFTKILIDDIGPVTTSVGRLQDRNNSKLWVFFGEGRYFYPQDDVSHVRRFYGVADPCYRQYADSGSTYSQYSGDSYSNYAMGTDNTDARCPSVTGPAVTDSYTADVSGIDLQRQDTPTATLTAGKKGWFVNMAPSSGSNGAERVVSDVAATFNGTVYFTTFTPTTDPCTPGGSTSMWAVKYDTGGTPSADSLKGKAPVQTSSGGITMIDLATSFTQNSGRKLSAALSPVGMTPKGKFPPLLQPKASKMILNIQER
ncbi:MAG: hypothetical protein WCP20_16185 [Desulfuromonadales bacterium]